MLTPAVANNVGFFYALGNTPATRLTRSIPHGQDAHILSLGCGDLRNVLYTAFTEMGLPKRQIDITACDYDEKVIGRNIILLTLILDTDEDKYLRLWNIYYHLRVDERAIDVLLPHLQKLLSHCESIDTWEASRYGRCISFCNDETFNRFRDVCKRVFKATTQRGAREFQQDVVTLFRTSSQIRQNFIGRHSHNLTNILSAAPLASVAVKASRDLDKLYWTQGVVAPSRVPNLRPNPMFAGLMSDHSILHYATDPLQGYHLAVGYAPTASGSPLNPMGKLRRWPVPGSAIAQFKAWIAAFRTLAAERRIKLRYVVSDALVFCHTLQHVAASGQLSANWYSRQFSLDRFVLDEFDYEVATGKAPTMFDVIDTSNLSDHIGALNLFIAASPLLKKTPWAAIHTELLTREKGSQQQILDDLLCGHWATVSLILGLTPVQYWTNAKIESHVDEYLLGLSTAMSRKGETQLHSRIAWRRDDQFSGQYAGRGKLHLETDVACRLLLDLYRRMFNSESIAVVAAAAAEGGRRNLIYGHFTRSSFVALLKLAMGRIKTDWPAVLSQLTEAIHGDRQLALSSSFSQELSVQMHLQGVATLPCFIEGARGPPPEDGPLQGWKDIPSVVVLTLMVPRDRLSQLFEGSSNHKFSSPTLVGILSNDPASPHQWHNLYGDVHMVFGNPREDFDHPGKDCFIEEDEDGWEGLSPLFVSFAVPSVLLLDKPGKVRVGLQVLPSLQSTSLYLEMLGLDMIVFGTTLNDEKSVFASRFMPGLPDHRVVCGNVQPFEDTIGDPSKDEKTTISVEMSDNSSRVSAVTCRLDMSSEKALARLKNKDPFKLQQRDPFIIDLVFEKDESVYPLRFPIPVTEQGSKTRVARTSGYVEVVAPLADPLSSKILADFFFPTRLSPEGVPVPLNVPITNLNGLAVLRLGSREKEKLTWLNPLTAFQFSAREKRLREAKQAKSGTMQDARVRFKDSLLSMFMLVSGLQGQRLQGQQSRIFALNHPEKGGIHMLILVSAVRLDGDTASAVIDAALLPFTKSLVMSPTLRPFLLEIQSGQVCQINVDDEELALWKKVIPSMVERCRTWRHRPMCDYKRAGQVPLSVKPEKKFLCSCGNGVFPDNFFLMEHWEDAKADAVRVAISPTYAVPFVEDIADELLLEQIGSTISMSTPKEAEKADTVSDAGEETYEEPPEGIVEKCAFCGTKGGIGTQRHWKTHKMVCMSYKIHKTADQPAGG
ncbi:MYND finger family protein [Ophiocordyceps camponoti-floridani]|uniref:MYND finger family protein n=1 Tax=Ophiocordyceps camponoti-floridani TaxID=2030778 RepID=A0A8H4Q841_9HYPO|nr:MYND finger family protein [Ophiocordyceps camponoti-floridani]